jgi:hypothetical protein
VTRGKEGNEENGFEIVNKDVEETREIDEESVDGF